MSASCFNCGHALTTQEVQDGWCEACGKRLPAGVTTHASDRPTYEPERSSYSSPISRSERQPAVPSILGWGTVRAGLAQVVIGLILALIGSGLLALLIKTSSGKRGEDSEMLLMLFSGAMVVGAVLIVAGICMSCAVPEAAEARGAAVGSVVFLILVVVLFLVHMGAMNANQRAILERLDGLSLNLRGQGGYSSMSELPFSESFFTALRFGALAVSCLQALCYVIFLRRVAMYFRNSSLGSHLIGYLVVSLVTSGLVVLLSLAETRTIENKNLILWFALGSLVVLSIWFTILVGAVRGTVTRSLSK